MSLGGAVILSPLCAVWNQRVQVSTQSGADGTKMGQIRDFFRSDFSEFGAGRQMH